MAQRFTAAWFQQQRQLATERSRARQAELKRPLPKNKRERERQKQRRAQLRSAERASQRIVKHQEARAKRQETTSQRQRQRIEGYIKDLRDATATNSRCENAEPFLALSVEEQIEIIDEAELLHREYVEGGHRPLGHTGAPFYIYH